MGKEFETWRALRRRRAVELAEEEATTASSLIPLQAELAKIEDQIKEKQVRLLMYHLLIRHLRGGHLLTCHRHSTYIY